MTPLAAARSAAEFIAARGARGARIGLVLGSGLGAFADVVEGSTSLPYGEIPGFPVSAVTGHKGHLVTGTVAGIHVVVLAGRVHRYEGWTWTEVVHPVRTLAALGVDAVVLTNAAGGINAQFAAGDLMLITDHLNLTGSNPLTGKNDPEMGPRFPDMSTAYAPAIAAAIDGAARQAGVKLVRGVYAGLLGPTYETPAEIRMLRTFGADAVGMSTVAEAIALNHMGVQVGAVSCITNLAAGLSSGPLSHDEVKETADRVESRFISLLEAAVPAIAGVTP